MGTPDIKTCFNLAGSEILNVKYASNFVLELDTVNSVMVALGDKQFVFLTLLLGLIHSIIITKSDKIKNSKKTVDFFKSFFIFTKALGLPIFLNFL